MAKVETSMAKDKPTSGSDASVSVIIPAYNASRFLGECLRSVLNQTHPPTEVIVVDDGSTDNTAEVVHAFGSQIRYTRKENGGPSSARNVGLRIATGYYIAFQDADDVWLPEKLALQVDYLAKHPEHALVYSDLSEVDVRLGVLQPSKYRAIGVKPREGYVFERQVINGFIFPPTTLFRREVMERIGLFDESLQQQEDTEFFVRLTYHYTVGFVPVVTLLRRRHDNNLSNNFNENSLRTSVLVLSRFAKELPVSRWLRFRLRLELAGRYGRLARHDLGQKRVCLAREEALKSLSLWPFTLAWLWLALSFVPQPAISLIRLAKAKVRAFAGLQTRIEPNGRAR